MRVFWQGCYSGLVLPLLLLLVRVAAWKDRKIRQSLQGRRGLWSRIETALAARDPDKPLVWFHVASAGEFLQAQPVMGLFITAGYQCVVTVTSITGYQWGSRRNPETAGPLFVDFLPLDTRANARRLMRLLQPRALVFVKFDLWPNVIWEAARAGIPQFLVSATLHGESHRYTSAIARSLYRTIYACFAGIYAVTEEDRERFLTSCPGHPCVFNVGDTRFDSILERKKNLIPFQMPPYVKAQPVFIVGSSWPTDEVHVFPVLTEALAAFPELVALLVPHEVDGAHLKAIEDAFGSQPLVRLSDLSSKIESAKTAPRIILVDSVGKLSALYHYADFAYVGGGFGQGVHNVAEPLVMGVPAIFGPVYKNSPEALEFLQRGFCFAIEDAEGLKSIVFGFLKDPNRCHTIGKSAAQAIEGKGGASQQCFNLIRTVIA